MFIKEKKLNNGLDGYIRISLSSSDEFLGHQQEIDNLTKFKSDDLVNPVVDVEKRKFKLDPSIASTLIKFYFSGSTSFVNAGFTNSEISGDSRNIKNSFFILDFYDSFDPNVQNKIFKTYLTKLDYEPVYNITDNLSNQLYYWYVPVSYIVGNTGNTVTGYVKFSFYNAKTGSLTIFYNNDNNALTTPEKYYFEVYLNFSNRTWKFKNNNVNAIEQKYTGAINYNNRVNDTFDKVSLEKQVFPTGNTYNYRTNRYLDFK